MHLVQTQIFLVEPSDPLRAELIHQIDLAGPNFNLIGDVADLGGNHAVPVPDNAQLMIIGLGAAKRKRERSQLLAFLERVKALHSNRDIALIFLVEQPLDLELAESLSTCQPFAVIPKLGRVVDPVLQLSLQAALHQAHQRPGQSAGLAPPEPDAIVFHVDQASGKILYQNQGFKRFFPAKSPSSEELWWKVFGLSSEASSALCHWVKSDLRVAIPPTLLTRADGTTTAMKGEAYSVVEADGVRRTLQLRECRNPLIAQITEALGVKNTALVLGLDGAYASGIDLAAFMMDLRVSLLEIIRQEDTVFLPVGGYLAIIMEQTSELEAENLARALLSHLQAVKDAWGGQASDIRFAVGLARRELSSTALGSLVAANNALLCLLHDVRASARIRLSQKDDKHQLAKYVYSPDGIFSDNIYAPEYHKFLWDITTAGSESPKPETALESMAGLIVQQPSLFTAAIFFKADDGLYKYLVGGKKVGAGFKLLSETSLPDSAIADPRRLQNKGSAYSPDAGSLIQPLNYRGQLVGYLALAFVQDESSRLTPFSLELSALHILSTQLYRINDRRRNLRTAEETVAVTQPQQEIEGYVVDNMEGAVDQAVFLAKIDMPVAIIGARGTGKMYVAKIIHQEWGGSPGMIVQIDCREFRNKDEASSKIVKELSRSEGKTLVFKSPHLMSPEAQIKLARQLSTRMLADVSPARYLPEAKYVALLPVSIERLVEKGELSERLASVFGGYPINVPPIKDRKQAVLRWAHKILGQECVARKKRVSGFTPDAEKALLAHDWQGNISEMRSCITAALEKTDKEWITPVDLGIFKGISADGALKSVDPKPFLVKLQGDADTPADYLPTIIDELDVALGELVGEIVAADLMLPLGSWLEDEIVLASLDRYKQDAKQTSEFLHTKARNIHRWMPKIEARSEKRGTNAAWRDPSRLVHEWIRESPHLPISPMTMGQNLLISHVSKQCEVAGMGPAVRAKIMGVSVPTYNKRLQQMAD